MPTLRSLMKASFEPELSLPRLTYFQHPQFTKSGFEYAVEFPRILESVSP